MTRTLLAFLGIVAAAALIWTASAIAQTSITTSSGLTRATVNPLAPASSCFICECNNQDFACRSACQANTNFTSRQQCEAACGRQQSTCLANAQKQQRTLDDQRAAAQQGSASGATN